VDGIKLNEVRLALQGLGLPEDRREEKYNLGEGTHHLGHVLEPRAKDGDDDG